MGGGADRKKQEESKGDRERQEETGEMGREAGRERTKERETRGGKKDSPEEIVRRI